MSLQFINNKIKRIACVQLEPKLPDFCKHVIMPRYGLPVIGSLLKQAGYEVKVFIEHVAPPDMDWVLSSDVLLLSSFTGAANRTCEFVERVRSKRSIPVILGGEHASSFAEESLDWADFVLRGEGDQSILDLLNALGKDLPLNNISGLSYKQGNNIIHNPMTKVPENIDVVHDLGIIHYYPKEYGFRLLLKRRKAKIICVQATRGCPFGCSFCVAPRLFNYTYRLRDIEAIIEDIRIKLPYGRDFLFTDNIFALNIKKVNILLDRMIEEGFGKAAEFTSFCRIEISKEPETLKKMYRAGFRYICLGLESIDDRALKDINKRQTRSDMITAIRKINDAGIKVSSSFIAGNDTDTPGTLSKIVDFAIENKLDSLHFISLWYYPGDPRCPMPLERIIIPNFDFCTGSFVTHFPMRIKPSMLQRSLVAAQRKFWSIKRALKSALRFNFRHALHLITHRYAYVLVEKEQLRYAKYLETIEDGYYDQNQCLRLDRIAGRPIDPLVARAAKAGNIKLDSAPPTASNNKGA